jgi:murein DD-endopeptidase MepM/ murein hydrolase activator NlpD
VHNKDVGTHRSICLILILLCFSPALQGNSINDRNHDRNSPSISYDSYENYLPSKAEKKSAPEPSRISTRAKKNKRSYQSQKPITRNARSRPRTHCTYYRIKPGDSLFRISRRFGISLTVLRTLNGIRNDNAIKAGSILKLPSRSLQASKIQKRDLSSHTVPDRSNRPDFRWPLRHVCGFRHDGINGVKSIGIIIIGAPGSPVMSSASGMVKKVGRMRGFGNYIVINHHGRYSTVYAHLGEISVSEGEPIRVGNVIGKIDNGRKDIHFQIDHEGKPQDPLDYLPLDL